MLLTYSGPSVVRVNILFMILTHKGTEPAKHSSCAPTNCKSHVSTLLGRGMSL